MKKITAALILASCAFGYTVARASEPSRLQLHASYEAKYYDRPSVFVSAICDTGNGTMLYVSTTESTSGGVHTTIVLNGCTKTPAER